MGRKGAAAPLTSADIQNDTITSAKIVADTILASDLADEVGVETTHHKLPVHANDAARNSAIGSPANGMIIYNTDAGALQQYNGVWSTIAPAPNISSVSGFLNDDTDSTLTIFGSNFTASTTVKMFTATSGGTQIGSDATTTFNSNAKLTAVFGAGSIGASGSTAYIEVDNVGATNRFATAITVNADPTVVHAGATGTSANTTTHLGTYTGTATAGGPIDSNTKLLLNFDRGGGTDFEDSSNIGGDGHKTTASADAIIKASPFGDGKSAMFFDGTNDQLHLTDHADFRLGTSSCVELWVYITNLTLVDGARHIISHGGQGNTADKSGWCMLFDGGNVFKVRIRVGSTNYDLLSTTTIVVNTWYHVAWTRDGTTARIFINGVLEGTSTGANQIGQTPDTSGDAAIDLEIGSNHEDAADLSGYLDEIRIVNGSAIHTSNFTPTTTRIDSSAEASTTKLLIGGGKTPAEVTSSSAINTTASTSNDYGYQIGPGTLTVTGSIHSIGGSGIAPALTFPASGKAFGSSGAYFDGTGDYLTMTTQPALGAGAYTFDFWLYYSSTQSSSTNAYIWDGGINNTENVIAIYITKATNRMVVYDDGSDAVVFTDDAALAITNNTWTHVALVRETQSTNGTKLYYNGVLVATGTSAGTLDQTARDPRIGGYGGSHSLTGYIDVFRISNTARWPSAFTPPTSLYGELGSPTIPTITFTGSATQLAADEDIEFTSVANTTKAAGSQHLTDTGIGLTLTNLTGGDKNKATLTGAIASGAGTSHSGMPLKAQVRKTLGNAAYANASRVVTFSGGTVTTGLVPAMPVSGTGIPVGATITSVDTSTTITLSADPTGGTLTGQSLVFSDLTRVAHVNGAEVLATGDSMLSIATGTGGGTVLFNARRYVGNQTDNHSITGFGFAPDMVWSKARNGTFGNGIHDVVRGPNKTIRTNTTGAEVTDSSPEQSLNSFDSDGFTAMSDNNTGTINLNYNYIAYGWKAGGTAVSNTDGSLTSSVSANVAGGFSIVSYTGQGSAATLGHGLSSAPEMMIVKRFDGGSGGWAVYHEGTDASAPEDKYLQLQSDIAFADATWPWNDTAPTSSVFSVGSDNGVSGSGFSYIAYCFHAVAGVSAFGSYTGNAGANTITYTGSNSFTARFIIVKKISSTGSWMMFDSFRESTALKTSRLKANGDDIEYSHTVHGLTPTSTGFSFAAAATDSDVNASGTYIYMAFA